MCRHPHLAVHSQTPNQRPIFTRGHQPVHVARIRNAYARVAALHLHTKSIPYLRLFLFFLFFSIRRVSLRIVTRQPPQLCPSGARRSSIVRCCCIRPSLNVRFTTAAHIHLPPPPPTPPPSSPLVVVPLPSFLLPSYPHLYLRFLFSPTGTGGGNSFFWQSDDNGAAVPVGV